MSERPDYQEPLPDDAEYPADEDEREDGSLPLGSDDEDEVEDEDEPLEDEDEDEPLEDDDDRPL